MNGEIVRATKGKNGQLRISVEDDLAHSFFAFVRNKDGNPHWPARHMDDHTFTANGTLAQFKQWKTEWLKMVEALNH